MWLSSWNIQITFSSQCRYKTFAPPPSLFSFDPMIIYFTYKISNFDVFLFQYIKQISEKNGFIFKVSSPHILRKPFGLIFVGEKTQLIYAYVICLLCCYFQLREGARATPSVNGPCVAFMWTYRENIALLHKETIYLLMKINSLIYADCIFQKIYQKCPHVT